MKSITVYQADENGHFLYQTTASELYLSPGNFNVPYCAVEVEPPVAAGGMVPKWDGLAWTIVEDHRHETLYVAETGQEYHYGAAVQIGGESVTFHGTGPIPHWLTTTAAKPPMEEPVAE